MAIALDSSSNGTATTTSPLTWNHTCTGSNLVLIVGVVLGSSGAPTVSVKYNSVSMTEIQSQVTGNTSFANLFYLLNPATGSNQVEVTFTGGLSMTCNAGAVSWTGVVQSGQPDASTRSTANLTTNPSITVTTSANNCWVVGVCCDGASLTAGLTNRYTGAVGTKFGSLEDTNGPKTPAGGQTVNWTASSNFWGAIGASFSPIADSPGTTNIIRGFMKTNKFW